MSTIGESGSKRPVEPASGASVGCRFRIGAMTIRLRSDLPEIERDFGHLYPSPFEDAVVDAKTGGADDEILIEVRAVRRGWWRRRAYEVWGDGERLWTATHPREVLPYVEWGINWRVIDRRSDFLQLHAATLAWCGGGSNVLAGLILAGVSGAGKSTLTAGLIAAGWRYYSDEFALIEPSSGRLHAFPKAPCIKQGSFPIIERLGLPMYGRGHYVKALKGPVGYVDLARMTTPTVTPPGPVRLVIFPRYIPGAKARLEPISRAASVMELASTAFNRRVFGSRAVEILTAVVRDARCYRLTSGDLSASCQCLNALAGDVNAPASAGDLHAA